MSSDGIMDYKYTAKRSQTYKLLSMGYSYPSKNFFYFFRKINFPIRSIEKRGDLETEYISLFDAPTPGKSCPPYEGSWRDIGRSSVLFEVKRFYKFFGLDVKGSKELPDHIALELEFMHYLTFRQADALRKNDLKRALELLLPQKDFLERHLAAWVPTFSEKLEERSELEFYRELAALTRAFIIEDLEYIRNTLS
jgi:DMSO reductase family type II enzyme chaperone